MSSRMEHLTISFFAVLEERGQKNLLEWCMRENLISSRYECPKCGKNMVMRERKGTIDGYEWRCRTKGGENPHDSMNEFAVKDVRVNKNTVVDWYMFCREVCMAAILKESEPLGGEGKIVEIDESMFGKMNGAKSNERGTLSVIKEWVVPGSVIISDCWRAYNCLSHEGYQHLRVNHSLTFKDPETGAHTNSIEGTWSAIKRSLRNHAAHVEGEFDHYLAEYMWRRRRGHSLDDDVFREFLRAITTLYPPMEKDVPSLTANNFGFVDSIQAFLIIKDAPRTGRSVVENVSKITEIIEVDRHIQKEARSLGATPINNKKNMMGQISFCEALAKRNEIDPFLKRIVTGDENWVTYDNIVRKLSGSTRSEAAQTVAKQGLTARKILQCIWWD
ncbi:mitotic-spindle organizing protein 2A [Trichonephila clavipes]|nr:mitotic-spindle organizing protein 2A [Trichonephila clavipes]